MASDIHLWQPENIGATGQTNNRPKDCQTSIGDILFCCCYKILTLKTLSTKDNLKVD